MRAKRLEGLLQRAARRLLQQLHREADRLQLPRHRACAAGRCGERARRVARDADHERVAPRGVRGHGRLARVDRGQIAGARVRNGRTEHPGREKQKRGAEQAGKAPP